MKMYFVSCFQILVFLSVSRNTCFGFGSNEEIFTDLEKEIFYESNPHDPFAEPDPVKHDARHSYLKKECELNIHYYPLIE